MALFKDSFNYEELIDCAKGKLAGVDFPKLPLPPMLMFDEITSIKETGGAYNKGTAHAQFEITPDKWFFPCHFENDPVMPGCLGMDALWQLLGFSLGNMGGRGKGRAISVGEVKFTGMVTPQTKKVTYEVNFSRVINRKLKIGIAINPENFDKKYIESIRKIVDVIYFDMNVYRKKSIKKYSLRKSIKQIQFIKSKNIPVYIGGGIDKKNVSKILKQIKPFGLDISRSLKNQRNLISKSKLKDFLNQISVG